MQSPRPLPEPPEPGWPVPDENGPAGPGVAPAQMFSPKAKSWLMLLAFWPGESITLAPTVPSPVLASGVMYQAACGARSENSTRLSPPVLPKRARASPSVLVKGSIASNALL